MLHELNKWKSSRATTEHGRGRLVNNKGLCANDELIGGHSQLLSMLVHFVGLLYICFSIASDEFYVGYSLIYVKLFQIF